MATPSETRKIMTKPLPEILDEIEGSIGLADEAAKNAREAAAEARRAGDKAVEEATRNVSKRIVEIEKAVEKGNVETNGHIAKIEEAIRLTNEHIAKIEEAIRLTNEHIVKVEQIATNGLRLAELLRSAVMEGVLAVDKRISDKAADIKSVPEPDNKSAHKRK
jgi:DNA-directed RNA polymerase alpha subunit